MITIELTNGKTLISELGVFDLLGIDKKSSDQIFQTISIFLIKARELKEGNETLQAVFASQIVRVIEHNEG